ncbi:hypothetical protein BC629DRAFT_1545610 [Irpex lacteus]|nr:hypothetical protein BC629DRAFT_1545610 [Irpex lacteus]
MSNTSPSSIPAVASLTDLPNELVCMLSTYMPATDIVQLLSSCKAMHIYMSEEAIWRRFCIHYGVDDPSDLGSSSYFEIYSVLLHKYGPLIGLWAGDLPFLGSIIEFRVDARARAIVGETWILLPTSDAWVLDSTDKRRPPLPEYDLFLSISLPSGESSKVSLPKKASLSWRMDDGDTEEMSVVTDASHFPTLRVLSEIKAATYLRCQDPLLPDGFCQHPLFPHDVDDVWYDASRGLPRIGMEPSPQPLASTPGLSSLLSEGSFAEALFTAGGDIARPKAFLKALLPSNRHQIQGAIADLRDQDTTPSPNGLSPTDAEWSPASLDGIWLGDYSGYGTEVLWLSYNSASETINAWKITGDTNVPRGFVSWNIHCGVELNLQDPQIRAPFGRLEPARLYRGTGTISVFGFIANRRHFIDAVAGIIGPNDIAIEWHGLMHGFVCRYRRYVGRNPATETQMSEFVRRARESD